MIYYTIKSMRLFIAKQQTCFILVAILLFGFWLRHENIKGANLVFDFDQIEDQFYTLKLAFDHDLLIIGRAIYGDPKLHHGVFYYYYNFIPFLISGGNLFASAYWNIFFNSATSIIVFILAKSMFRKTQTALISAFIAATSFEFIKFSNWLTIDTVAIFLLPLFYLGLWEYYKGKKWGLILSAVSLGLSLQTDLSFLYLIPILLIYCAVFKPKILSFKLFSFSILSFIISISTLILTEIKLNFSGIKYLLNFSTNFSEATKLAYIERLLFFVDDFSKNFSNNLLPQRLDLGIYLAAVVILVAIYKLYSIKTKREERSAILFLLLYLFSPAITLLIGYHNKPWFLIGLPPAIALISGYAISKLKYPDLILAAAFIIGFTNTNMVLERPNEAYKLFDSIYDSTSYLKYQLEVLDYTYKSSEGKPFAINATTYPLYYNGMWAYLLNFYGKGKYGYVPNWLGGDQLHPYDLLPKSNEDEKIFYMIISETARIPEVFKNKGRVWGADFGALVEEKKFNGFTILKYERP